MIITSHVMGKQPGKVVMSNARLERRILKARKNLEEIERKPFASDSVRREYVMDAVYRLNHLQYQYDNRVVSILGGGKC
jgi:hypothetical protein